MQTKQTRILASRNNVRLVQLVNSRGQTAYQVNTPETEEYAADLFYEGSDLKCAQAAMRKATE